MRSIFAVDMGADGLFIKPTGIDDSETRISTRQYAPKLIETLALVIDRHFSSPDQPASNYLFEFKGEKDQMARLLKTWQAFKNR